MAEDFKILEGIIAGEQINPVYQPIVSLMDGGIFAYEAFSRISDEKQGMNIERMFRAAGESNRSRELETLCWTKALEGSRRKDAAKKLFLNVSSHVIHDEEFKKSATRNSVGGTGAEYGNIIVEITKKTAVTDNEAFLASIDHYKNHNYGISIDDVGAGYAGLNVIASVRPHFIKLDMHLVRDIDKDETKRRLCKAMIDFSGSVGIKVIAEGIETEEELKTLIALGTDYGQGYFLGKPRESFEGITHETVGLIQRCHAKSHRSGGDSVHSAIGHLTGSGCTFAPDTEVEHVYQIMRQNPAIMGFTVLEEGKAVGFMTKSAVNELFAGKSGDAFDATKSIRAFTRTDFLKARADMPVDEVSKLAMERPPDQLYDPVVIEEKGQYAGVVTVKDLLDAYMKTEIDIAGDANPLTKLPGNLLIEKEIASRARGKSPYCVLHFDVDNFKAYNDAYGIQRGDQMLSLVAETLKERADRGEFVGHVGGDDFIVICDYHEGETYCQAVFETFSRKLSVLYRREDLEKGYITSKNRRGETRTFPIASLSAAGVSNRSKAYQSPGEISRDIAALQHKCKNKIGNCFEVR